MKIKTQFIIFVCGVILLPIFFFVITFFIAYYSNPQRLLVPSYEKIISEMREDASLEDFSKLLPKLSRLSPSLDFLLFNENEKLVYSTLDTFSVGESYKNDRILNYMSDTGNEYVYQCDFLNLNNDKTFCLITRINRKLKKTPMDLLKMTHLVQSIVLGFILFCACMISLILRSITKSVIMLDKATQRIAAGNLEEEVVITGNNEITSLSDSLNKMRIGLKDAQLRRSRFVMGISHDLRTPVALIKGYTEGLADGVIVDDEMRKKSFKIISSKISQLETMIDDLINFMKLDTGEWRHNLSKHNIYEFFNNFFHDFVMNVHLLGKTLTTELNLPTDLEVIYDERLFIRVIENLFSNAIRYTKDGGNIFIFVNQNPNKDIVIRFKDDGIGIKKEDIPYIFEPFYRGSNSRREEGSGLGLSVVKNIIDSHGWEINVKSDIGHGTEFIIVIPHKVQ